MIMRSLAHPKTQFLGCLLPELRNDITIGPVWQRVIDNRILFLTKSMARRLIGTHRDKWFIALGPEPKQQENYAKGDNFLQVISSLYPLFLARHILEQESTNHNPKDTLRRLNDVRERIAMQKADWQETLWNREHTLEWCEKTLVDSRLPERANKRAIDHLLVDLYEKPIYRNRVGQALAEFSGEFPPNFIAKNRDISVFRKEKSEETTPTQEKIHEISGEWEKSTEVSGGQKSTDLGGGGNSTEMDGSQNPPTLAGVENPATMPGVKIREDAGGSKSEWRHMEEGLEIELTVPGLENPVKVPGVKSITISYGE